MAAGLMAARPRPARGSVNYRSAGTRYAPRAHRGAVGAAGRSASREPPSIPSRFQAEPRGDDARERSGFGTRVQRFAGAEDGRGVPGPGSYHRGGTLVLDGPSVGARGYLGGFASRSRRFSDRADLEAGALPGPGAYAGEAGGPSAASRRGEEPPMRLFAKTRRGRMDGPGSFAGPARQTPAPGQYRPWEAEGRFTMRHKSKPTAAFAAARAAPRPAAAAGAAGPGSYEVGRASDALCSHGEQAAVPSAAFRSRSKRGFEGEMAAYLVRDAPGPGAYEVARSDALVRTDRGMRERRSAAFANGAGRFSGRASTLGPSADPTPGPGAYAAARGFASQAPAATGVPGAGDHVFRSRSGRLGGGARSAAPGPAFYTPQLPDKRSYLINTRRQWI